MADNNTEHTAADYNLANCSRCLSLTPIDENNCRVCSRRLHLRHPNSLQRTLALVVTAMILYIPANMYPIMSTTLFGRTEPSTILGGVILFFEMGSYFVASVIFIASIIIPIAKMLAIIWLCYCAKSNHDVHHLELTRLYKITEFIGKWSMIDVFVVAILVALVQITGFMTIHPGLAAQAFAGVVILTMLSAQQLDIRLIWDNVKRTPELTKDGLSRANVNDG
ncbi:paraquat-inducible protein A [Glaciecola siphonariae]|uniref:Paraquat-inducible protein A n=1 Tax=Glaciecola siphonariae TaxID=521012 RepID=A0ABV9LZC5_9ALTE